eukprot:CAMPEP_0119331436 /NCGR_PEP_ID=MMETSP1333-20130426/80617_1 /TAXON_ID=418940 /ORGANISM="Scyphosphaera apsteinii, Strain RCC1455" /LENGTH=445 /DNA_ID=CAMNT_0007341041 /DNA_START=303 /DNA_END=1640 /DNA_ORIENTATION=-
MYSNVTGLSLGFGFNFGLATLCAQAYGAGRAMLDNPVLLRRSWVVLTFAFAFTLSAAIFCEPIMRRIGQPADVSRTTSRFAQVHTVGIPFLWLVNGLEKCCDGIHQTRPSLYAQLAAAAFQVAFCVVALHPQLLNWGYLGMAVARVVGALVQFGVLVVCIRLMRLEAMVWRQSSRGSCSAVFSWVELRMYLSVSLPAAFLMWAEWWAFEGLTVIVGWLPSPKVALGAHATLFNLIVVTYMVFTGLSNAVCAAVGKSVGAGQASVVPLQCVAAVLISVVLAAAVATAMFFGRDALAILFTSDARVRACAVAAMAGPCISVGGYSLLMTLFGVCRGANVQRWVTLQTLVGYAAGIPLAYYLGVRTRGGPPPLLGVWLGNAAALYWGAFASTIIACRVDWSSVKGAAEATPPQEEPFLGHLDEHGDEEGTRSSPRTASEHGDATGAAA